MRARQLAFPPSCEPQTFDQLAKIAGQVAHRRAGATRRDRGFWMRGQSVSTAPRVGERCSSARRLPQRSLRCRPPVLPHGARESRCAAIDEATRAYSNWRATG
jgi:hypothetical protein